MPKLTDDEENVKHDGDKATHDFVMVSVATTSGYYPEDGFIRVPSHQKISVILGKAAKALALANTTGWVARTTENLKLNIDSSYEENDLCGEITIDWSMPEGGGGRG